MIQIITYQNQQNNINTLHGISSRLPDKIYPPCHPMNIDYFNYLVLLANSHYSSWTPNTLYYPALNSFPPLFANPFPQSPTPVEEFQPSSKLIDQELQSAATPQETPKSFIHWSVEEERHLRKLGPQLNFEWKVVAQNFKNKSPSECQSRYLAMIHLNQRRGWSKAEDAKLLELVARLGQDWKQISQELNKKINSQFGRTPKQIRQRYLNYLRPDIVDAVWTKEEDRLLIELVKIQGKKWKQFEKELAGRTENKIKNRYYGYIKKHYTIGKARSQKNMKISVD